MKREKRKKSDKVYDISTGKKVYTTRKETMKLLYIFFLLSSALVLKSNICSELSNTVTVWKT